MRLIVMLLPWLELFTLIQLGIETSALTALLYVLATLVLGMVVLRRQGMQLFERLRDVQQGRVLGSQLLVDDMAVGFAGLLLIFPGMISDVAALVVMIGCPGSDDRPPAPSSGPGPGRRAGGVLCAAAGLCQQGHHRGRVLSSG